MGSSLWGCGSSLWARAQDIARFAVLCPGDAATLRSSPRAMAPRQAPINAPAQAMAEFLITAIAEPATMSVQPQLSSSDRVASVAVITPSPMAPPLIVPLPSSTNSSPNACGAPTVSNDLAASSTLLANSWKWGNFFSRLSHWFIALLHAAMAVLQVVGDRL